MIDFRMEITRNNFLQSAKFMSKDLFHGRVHPQYQQTEMLDTVHSFSLPEKLQSFLDVSSEVSSDVSKGQGYVFLLEEI